MDKKQQFKQFLAGMGEIGVFVMLMIAVSYAIVKYGENARQQSEHAKQIKQTNEKIVAAHAKIDSIRHTMPQQITDSLMHHPEYRYIIENQKRIDSLGHANDSLLNLAYSAAKKKSVIRIVRKNESVFYDFFHIPAVKNANWQYYVNKKEIQAFNKRKKAIDALPQMVNVHFTNQANMQISNIQRKIDSLLMQKDTLLNQKTK